MRLCEVLGTVVASAHHPAYDGKKVLLVRPIQPTGPRAGQKAGPGFVAVDTVQAGPGDRVLVLTEGNGVRQILGGGPAPIRSVIVGIVDDVHAAAAAS